MDHVGLLSGETAVAGVADTGSQAATAASVRTATPPRRRHSHATRRVLSRRNASPDGPDVNSIAPGQGADLAEGG